MTRFICREPLAQLDVLLCPSCGNLRASLACPAVASWTTILAIDSLCIRIRCNRAQCGSADVRWPAVGGRRRNGVLAREIPPPLAQHSYPRREDAALGQDHGSLGESGLIAPDSHHPQTVTSLASSCVQSDGAAIAIATSKLLLRNEYAKLFSSHAGNS